MSNLKPVLIKDPRIIVDNERYFGVLKSGLRFRQKPWTTNSVSTSNIPFSTPAPSFDIFVDRRISLQLPMRLSITCTCNVGARPLAPGYDAPRAYPIHSMLNTVTLTINNATITQYIGEIIHALLRFNNGDNLEQYDYSTAPTCLDNCQNYATLVNANSNVLGGAGNAPQGSIMGRGGFTGYIIVKNDPRANEEAPELQTAIVDILSIEQLMFSPLEFGSLQKNSSAFYNVSTMDWQFNFLAEAANRCWSRANRPESTWVSSQISFGPFINPAFKFGSFQPLLMINYITPDPVISKMYLQKPISYPYFPVTRYVTSTVASINYGADPIVRSIPSNNIQLSNIPKKLIIYARPTNSAYFGSPLMTDTAFAITSISLQFQNYSGLLAESNQVQLYQLARKNHCNLNWSSWSGQGQYPVGGDNFDDIRYGGVGSYVCLEMGTDIQLDPEYAPGSIGNFSLSVQANVVNCDPTGLHDNMQVDLYILTINDGIFTIPSGGVAFSELSILNTKDVIEANLQTDNDKLYLNYNDIQELSGGNFYTGVKDFGKNLGKKIMKANKYLRDNKVISTTADKLSQLAQAPLIRDIPFADRASNIAKDVRDISGALGYGYGGSVMGAGRVGKNRLQDRLRNI